MKGKPKTHVRNSPKARGLALLLLSIGLANQSEAQILKVLHSFSPTSTNSSGVLTNSDGAFPTSGLVLSGNATYGTADSGGTYGYGTVYAVNTDGSSFRTLHSFTGTFSPDWTNSDGAYPSAVLVLSGITLYGVTRNGGANGYGTIFAVNTDGSDFRNLHSFGALSNWTNSDGAYPIGGLVLSGLTLFGTASAGGHYGSGTMFAVNIDGTGFTNIYQFTTTLPIDPTLLHPVYTNNDGALPCGTLLLSSNVLYGMAEQGGNGGNGTVFALGTDGSGFTILHEFNYVGILVIPFSENLTLSGNTLYGAKEIDGGFRNYGTVFSVNIDGSSFSNVHAFVDINDGANPSGGLLLSGNTLYDSAGIGPAHSGTVFAVNTDGNGFTNLYSFTATSGADSTNRDGAGPVGGLILSKDALYGAAGRGGIFGSGTVFSLSFPPQLSVVFSRSSIILSWPINYAGFDYTVYTLQSNTNLSSPVWTTNLPAPVIVNGQFTVTNPISGTQQFFRLSE